MTGKKAAKTKTERKTAAKEIFRRIPIDAIEFVVSNHRAEMDPAKLAELTESIAAIGVQQPIKVCRRTVGAGDNASAARFVMVFGHRRLKAAADAGLTKIPAIVVDGWSDAEIAEAQVIENILREDLNPIEAARCVETLMDAGGGIETAAAKMNKSLDWCRRRLDLLRLDESVQAMVISGRLPLKHAALISRVGDKAHQRNIAAGATGGGYGHTGGDYLQPLGKLRGEISLILCKLGSARWPKDVPYAGRRPCAGCPDNTNTEPALFDGIDLTSKKGNCSNEDCYRHKARAWEKDPEKIARDKKRAAAKAAKAAKDGKDGEGPDGGKGRGDESYEERQKRIRALQRKFPWTAEQAFAAALWDYGQGLVEAIGAYIESGRARAEGRPVAAAILAALKFHWWKTVAIPAGIPTFGDLADGDEPGDDVLAAAWRKNAAMIETSEGRRPEVDWQGDVNNVPLDRRDFRTIGELESLAAAWVVEAPGARPDLKAVGDELAARTIVKGRRAEALEAIAASGDHKLLKKLLADDDAAAKAGEKQMAKWRREAVADRASAILLSWPDDSPEKGRGKK